MASARRALALAALALGVFAPGAAADHHFMRVTEVFGGASGNPSAQFVELQMFSPNQNAVNGTGVRFLTPTGAPDGTFSFGADVVNGADNDTILAATPQAAAFFGVPADLTIDPVMDRAGGKVEFQGKTATVDRFSWGSFSGSSTGSGTPFPGGLPLGLSVHRDVAGGTVAGQLDAADDTGSSSADFDAGQPSPRNNIGGTGLRATRISVFESGTFQLDAAEGVQNAIAISGPVDGFWKITETGAPLALAADAEECQLISVTEARCPDPASHFAVVLANDLDDKVTVTGPLSTSLFGGAGKDTLTGGKLSGSLHGGDGKDVLRAGSGTDFLYGGIGDDLLDGGNGPDDLEGGDGIDTVTYAVRSVGVTVSLDGATNDGSSFDSGGGRRDNAMGDVERITGGKGGDTLTGHGSANRLTGGPGEDHVFGLGGPDLISVEGDGFADTVDCGTGFDIVKFDAALDVSRTECETEQGSRRR